VVAGDGEGADAKARLFVGSPASVIRVTPANALDPEVYRGADLIFIASYDGAFVAAAADAARSAGSPLNVVDHPELSDFHTPAIIDRGQLVAAIGSAGAAPLMASLLRAEVELRIPPGAGAIAAMLGERREALRAAFPDLPLRRAFLRSVIAGPVAAAADAGDLALAGDRLDRALAEGWTAQGRVSQINAPAAPDLISVRAVRVLNSVDILVMEPGTEAIVAAHARRDAEHWGWERATAAALAAEVTAGRLVAILGDARGGDLVAALQDLGVTVERLTSAPPA
jgi:precorrin-2 dehydrogenase/sirohydrochlorin ferrochelatase